MVLLLITIGWLTPKIFFKKEGTKYLNMTVAQRKRCHENTLVKDPCNIISLFRVIFPNKAGSDVISFPAQSFGEN